MARVQENFMRYSIPRVGANNYYEHIVRDDSEWNVIREYIEKNPEMWEADELNSP